MNYAIRILLEQKELLTGEMEFAEGEERIATERRLADTANALNKLNLPDVMLSLPRPIEAYNKAQQLGVGKYCDWFLKEEKRGNEA